MNNALFLDLGGTLVRTENEEIYLDGRGHVEFLPNSIKMLKSKSAYFDKVFVVCNQPGIEKGTLPLEKSTAFIRQIHSKCGPIVSDYWICPFENSPFRKPEPGMVLALADKHFVNLKHSTFVGDSELDQQCAEAAGVGNFVWADTFFQRDQKMGSKT